MKRTQTSISTSAPAPVARVSEETTGRGPQGTALYVHLPFCEAKCHYCDFFSVAAAGWDIDGTLESVLHEARTRAPQAPPTVFIGGGTPSLLSRQQLEHFLGELQAITGFRDSATEVTLECNPESLDEDKVKCMLDLGVNRISIGFQSLEPQTLELFGRVHSVDQSFRAYDMARSAGMSNINLDMIYASPKHEPAAWREALQAVLRLEPEHLSAYNLAFEEETVFSRWLRNGKLEALPEETELELFEITREVTREHGLHDYEISNYARNGLVCAHNENYWANAPYLGVGPSAVSYVNGVRSGSPRDIKSYREAVAADGHAVSWSEELDPLARLGETWWLGLRRTRGVSPDEAQKESRHATDQDPMVATAREFVQHGLLEEVDGRFRLTSKGIPLADRVAAEFLQEPKGSE